MTPTSAPFRLALALTAIVLGGPAVRAAPTTSDPRPTGTQVAGQDDARLTALMERREFREAVELLLRVRADRPQDPFVRYNLACARAMLGERDRAAEDLLDALAAGFTDFQFMERDPNLLPIRDHPTYTTIIRGWAKILDTRAGAEAEAALKALGKGYSADSDPALRLKFVSAADPRSFQDARTEMDRVADWATAEVLGDTVPAIDPARPDPWVLVLLPTPNDFVSLVGPGDIGGYYDRDHKRLICQDLGPSLRHEFFHVLHWRCMDRLDQHHPFWVMEGLASLLEDVDLDQEGTYRLAPSWRTNIAKRLEKAGHATPWKALFGMPRDAFMGDRARGHYAEARSVMLYLYEQGKLRDWFRAYCDGFVEDPSGAQAIERVFGIELAAVERAYRTWLRALPEVGEQSRPGDASLGFATGPGRGDGVEITEAVATSRARILGEERPRWRDVITAIDGRQVRTLDDMYRVLSEMEVGKSVVLDLRRGTRRLQAAIELVASSRPAGSSDHP